MPPDRILEARKTYADLAAASQSLREQATALDKAIVGAAESVASLRTDVSQLHDELGELAAAVADHRRVLLRTWVMIFVPAVIGGLLGFLLGSAAADAWPWLLSG